MVVGAVGGSVRGRLGGGGADIGGGGHLRGWVYVGGAVMGEGDLKSDWFLVAEMGRYFVGFRDVRW